MKQQAVLYLMLQAAIVVAFSSTMFGMLEIMSTSEPVNEEAHAREVPEAD